MAHKMLARIEASSLERAGHDLAVAVAVACDANYDDVILIGPFDPVRHEGAVIALRVMLARPLGPLLVFSIVPDAVDFGSGTERARLRDGVIEALSRHCHVRAFDNTSELVAAACEPKSEASALLH